MATETPERISIVIPAMNEADSLPQLHREISGVVGAEGWDAEIIVVDDGSTDATWERVLELAREDPRVRGVRFRRNFGKAAALTAGFAAASAPIVFTLDADLQDSPAEMPRFLEALRSGCDLVSGWKRTRHDPIHKVFPSRVWNRMVSQATGVHLHDHNCGYKAYRREVLDEVDVYGEFHRYVPVLAAARGFRVGEVEVEHRARKHGVSKYGGRRFVRGAIDLLTVLFLTRAALRPAHVLAGWGSAFVAVGVLGQLLAVVCALTGWLTNTGMIAGWVSIVLLAAGFNLIGLGLVAQLFLARGGAASEQYSIVAHTPSPKAEDNSDE